MRDPLYFKFPTLVIGDTYGPFFLRPFMSADGSDYPALGVRMVCQVRTDTVQNGGTLLLTLCDMVATQNPPNKPNPLNHWYWVLTAAKEATAALVSPGEYPADVTLIYPDGTRNTRIQGAVPVIGGSNG